jgi:predicted RNase H-like HicB family nuclease
MTVGDNEMAKRYTVSDGKLMLTLEEAEEGGYVVTSPLDPELITEAETISEAFFMARDALRALAQSRAKLRKERSYATAGR